MEIPVVVAAASETAMLTRSDVRPPVVWHQTQIVRADVLTPFPDVAGHVVEPELIRRLGRDVVCPRRLVPYKSPSSEHSPSKPGPEQPRGKGARRGPARTVPR